MSVDQMTPLPTRGEVEAQRPADDRAAPIGLFQKEDDQLVAQLRLWWKESSDALTMTRTARDKEWAMLAGHQWDTNDEKRLTDAKRPALTLNLLQAMIAAVEGEERNNRQEIKLYGEEEGDDNPAWLLNHLVKWVMGQCGGEFNLSRMFRSGAAIGEGWVGFEVDYFDDPEGKINVVYVAEHEAFGDPLSTEPTGKDSRYFHRPRMYSPDEMEARWPGSTDKLKNAVSASGIGTETDGKGFTDIYLTPGDASSPKYYDAAKTQWAVLESCWTQIEPGWVVVNEQTGLLDEMSPEDFEKAKAAKMAEQATYSQQAMDGTLHAEQAAAHQAAIGEALGAHQAATAQAVMAPPQDGSPIIMPPPQIPPPPPLRPAPAPLDAVQRPIRRVYQAFSSFDTLLWKGAYDLPTVKRIPYVPFRSMWDAKDKCWYGLLRALVDMQKQHNVEQSAMVQLVQLMPKASWMAPKGSFHNRTEWENKIATPGAMLEYNARMGKPEQITSPAIPRHLVDMAMSRPQAMREISGVNIELTGSRQGSDPGVVMEQRKNAALTVLAPIFDNYRESKKEVGKILLAFIQKYISVGRRIRVLGPEKAQKVTMTTDMSMGRYDVIVADTNSTITDRIASLNVMQTTLPQMLKAGVPIAPGMIDLLPMDPDLRTEQKRLISWTLLKNGDLPPPDWQPGMPMPMPALPPGMAPPVPAPAPQ